MIYSEAALPYKIQCIIFNYVGSTKQFGHCRLVCHSWNSVAENAMFKRPIIVQSNEKAIQLYRHLSRNKSLAKSIWQMSFTRSATDEQYSSDDPFVKLIKVAFTPNMVILGGWMFNSKFYKQLIAIAKRSPNQFKRLVYLPSCECNRAYVKMIYIFRKSTTRSQWKLLEIYGDKPKETANTSLLFFRYALISHA